MVRRMVRWMQANCPARDGKNSGREDFSYTNAPAHGITGEIYGMRSLAKRFAGEAAIRIRCLI